MKLIDISNKQGKVKLNDVVHRGSVDRLIEEIDMVFGAAAAAAGADFGELVNCAENAADELEFEIHSPGGSILDGYRIYHAILALRDRGVAVTAIINTLAASMASVIAMAADKIKIVRGGRMMIHEASSATVGDANEHARMAKMLEEMSSEIAQIYADRTGADPEDIRQRMKKETWMGAEEAVAQGFADEIIAPAKRQGKKPLAFRDPLEKPPGMGIFSPDAQLKEQCEAQALRIAEIETELTTATAEVETLRADLATAREALAAAPNAEALAELTRERDEALAAAAPERIEAAAVALFSAESRPEAVAQAISAAASAMLAEHGHEKVDTEQTSEDSKTPHLDKFNSLKGGEATAYFKAHRKAIVAEQRRAK